jgi:hypothetical protein
MIHQDVLMRQLHQFTQALASLIHQAPREQPDDVLRAIDEACQAHLDGRADDLRTLPPDALLELCRDGEHVVADAFGTTVAALAERVEVLPVDDATTEALAALRNESTR